MTSIEDQVRVYAEAITADAPARIARVIDTAADPFALKELADTANASARSVAPSGRSDRGRRRASRGAWWVTAAAVVAVVAVATLAVRSQATPPTAIVPVENPATAAAGYIEESSRTLGLKIGDPCPSIKPTGSPAVATPPMDAVLAGDPSAGTCQVIAWMPHAQDPVVPMGYYRQDGTLLWDLKDPATKPTVPAPPDTQTGETLAQPSFLGDIQPGVPYQRPVTGKRKDGTLGYIGTETCVASVTPQGGGGQRCYGEQLTSDAFQADPTADPMNLPDYVPTEDRDGKVVGYVAKADLLDPPTTGSIDPANPPQSLPIPVYALDDLTTVIGYQYPARGFVPLGTNPENVPAIPIK